LAFHNQQSANFADCELKIADLNAEIYPVCSMLFV